MRNNLIKLSVCVLTVLAMSSLARATPIDLHRAVSGADRPFTTLKDNLPTEWQLWLEPRITGPASKKNWDYHFPERGYGNIYNQDQSQILELGTRRRMVEGQKTGIWLIWDMLAWVPVPHLLYTDEQENIGPWVNPWFNRRTERPAVSGLTVPDSTQLVPEPTSGALILIGSLLLVSRTTRRRYARV